MLRQLGLVMRSMVLGEGQGPRHEALACHPEL